MVPRYSRPEMTAIWSAENRYRIWWQIEVFAAEAMGKLGMIPPEDAATIGLAATEGQIMLTLRNPLDTKPTATTLTRGSSLVGDGAAARPAPASAEKSAAAPRARTPRAPIPPPVVASAPPPPPPYKVEAIRGAKRSEETLR